PRGMLQAHDVRARHATSERGIRQELKLQQARDGVEPRIIALYVTVPAMPHLLTLRGRNALSPFRVTKLKAALSAAHPDHPIERISATYWHFVEVGRELTSPERATLTRLLTYGPHDEAAPDDGAFLLVVPRPGTI